MRKLRRAVVCAIALATMALSGCLDADSVAGVASPAFSWAPEEAAEAGTVFVEPFYCGAQYPGREDCGIRFKIRRVDIGGQGARHRISQGGQVEVTMEVLHDCGYCGNAVNQVIVGLSSDTRAQASVWNGKQRSGGPVLAVNPGTDVVALAEDNRGPAQWVTVRYMIEVPNRPGTYDLRTRYAQAYQGNLMTEAARAYDQPRYKDVLDWWQVDRPGGPGVEATIGSIVVD